MTATTPQLKRANLDKLDFVPDVLSQQRIKVLWVCYVFNMIAIFIYIFVLYGENYFIFLVRGPDSPECWLHIHSWLTRVYSDCRWDCLFSLSSVCRVCQSVGQRQPQIFILKHYSGHPVWLGINKIWRNFLHFWTLIYSLFKTW